MKILIIALLRSNLSILAELCFRRPLFNDLRLSPTHNISGPVKVVVEYLTFFEDV